MKNRVYASILIGAVALACSCSSQHSASTRPAYKGAKSIDKSQVRFDDGDTFFIKDRPVRVLGIDAPEVAHPELGIYENQAYGIAASESTRAWILRSQTLEYVSGGRDRFGRRLAHVFIDGELLSVRLIENRLAYETVSYYGDNGFPDLAQRILDAGRRTPRPPFEPPHRWKKKHRPKDKR